MHSATGAFVTPQLVSSSAARVAEKHSRARALYVNFDRMQVSKGLSEICEEYDTSLQSWSIVEGKAAESAERRAENAVRRALVMT